MCICINESLCYMLETDNIANQICSNIKSKVEKINEDFKVRRGGQGGSASPCGQNEMEPGSYCFRFYFL